MPKVFLSYSHDDDAHKYMLLPIVLPGKRASISFSTEMSVQGARTKDGRHGPNAKCGEADFVLIACSEEYTRRYEGNDDGSDRGRGTVIEARAIQQFLYESKGLNARFRVVLFDPSHQSRIPLQLRGYNWFNPMDDESYAELIAWLKAGVKDTEAAIPEGPVWPEPQTDFKLDLADRRPHLEAVRAALAGQSSNRIFLFKGPGNSGKTQFLNELTNYADKISVPWTRLNFKGAPSIEELYENMLVNLGQERLCNMEAAGADSSFLALAKDLKQLDKPVLFLFDTYEKASEESKKWLETKFLPSIRLCPAVIVVVGGRDVPDREQFPWKALAEFRQLDPIDNFEDWKEYIGRVHKEEIEDSEIQTLTKATEGNPGLQRQLIENLLKRKVRE